MLLSTVVLILQETLEAAMLVSILTALSMHLGFRLRWLPWGMVAGLLAAMLYAARLQAISEAFDYLGQEILNATLQTLAAACVVLLAWRVFRDPQRRHALLFAACAAAGVALSICREGSEILIYLNGYLAQDARTQAVLLGTLIGVGIGVSIGLLMFYFLFGLPLRHGVPAAVLLLALFAGNMLAQAAVQLAQADLLGGTAALWDSGGFLPEASIPGRLLYALVGYEATPSVSQVACYAVGVLAVLLAAWLGSRMPMAAPD